MLESLKKHFGFKPSYFGGHSLGEYTALVAAGAIPFDIAVKLVNTRGKLMQSSAPVGTGSMAAIIMENLPRDDIMKDAEQTGVDVANDNSPAQLVISGEKSKVDTLCAHLSARYSDRGIRIVPLVVSAPFHSRHMKEVEQKFGDALKKFGDTFVAEKAGCVTSNFTGSFHTGSLENLIEALTRQISGRVRWRDNMSILIEKSREIFEVGPNRPLGGFFKASGISISSITDVRSAERALSKAAV
jgi:malonyl CoA-acyl carrier protein transacylase